MINFEYLGHSFILNKNRDYPDYYFICSKCGILIFDSSEAYIISSRWKHDYPQRILNLTCEEVIIKNIIE